MDGSSSKKRSQPEEIVLDDDELSALVDSVVASKKANISEPKQNGKAQVAEAFSLSDENITKVNSGEWISVDLEFANNTSSKILSSIGEDIDFYWYDAAVDPNAAINSVYMFGLIFNSKSNCFESASFKGNLNFFSFL